MQQKAMPSRLLIVGLGLIGGSLAAALRAAGFGASEKGVAGFGAAEGVTAGFGAAEKRAEILACDPDADEIARGIEMGLIDRGDTRLASLLEDVDLVVLAVPVLAMRQVMGELAAAGAVEQGLVITDVGSTKGAIREAAVEVFGGMPASLVLGHPIAGSEKSGVAAANPELYVGHKVILTPEPSKIGRAHV